MHRALRLLGNLLSNRNNLIFIHPMKLIHLLICLANRIHNFSQVKAYLLTISFDYAGFDCVLHDVFLSLYCPHCLNLS